MKKSKKLSTLVLVVSSLYLLAGYDIIALVLSVMGIVFLSVLFFTD